ncbi:MAG: DUF1150 family protein [Rhizobiaceae bacterium]|nr:DUF1150 family protein [Rhizobiaceae bacterium]
MTEIETRSVLSQEELAHLGEGSVAYLREFDSAELKARFPDAPDMAPGTTLWAVFAANGTPIMLADAQASAVAGAMQNDLTPVSVH